jgi:hypothetical protein
MRKVLLTTLQSLVALVAMALVPILLGGLIAGLYRLFMFGFNLVV